MKITQKQLSRIEHLHCERLSDNKENFRLVDEFFNGRNTSISDTLQNEARGITYRKINCFMHCIEKFRLVLSELKI